MKIDNSQHQRQHHHQYPHQYRQQHQIPRDLNWNTLSLTRTNSTTSTDIKNMPIEAENETNQGEIPASSDQDAFRGANNEHLSRRSRCPNRRGDDRRGSLNHMSSLEAQRQRPDGHNSRPSSAIGRNSRHSSIGSYHSNQSTRTQSGLRNSGRIDDNSMPRSQSRRQSKAEKQSSADVFQRPKMPFYPMPAIPSRGGIRMPSMPPLSNMLARRRSWPEPNDPSVQWDTENEQDISIRSGRRFGVSNEFEQLCPDPVVEPVVNTIISWGDGDPNRINFMISPRSGRFNRTASNNHRERRDHRISQTSRPMPNKVLRSQYASRRGERSDYSSLTSPERRSTSGERTSSDQRVERGEMRNGANGRRREERRSPREFKDEIQEEMARAQEMSLPVNLNRTRESSNLNPEASTFAPTLHDAKGKPFKMVSDKGICYFVPQDSRSASNPNYMVSTRTDGYGNEETTAQQNMGHRRTDHTIQTFQTVPINEHQNNTIGPTHQPAPSQPINTQHNEPHYPRLPLTPTENYDHTVVPVPQTQGYFSPIHNQQPLPHNVDYRNAHRPINSPHAMPTYPNMPNFPTFVTNGEQPMVPMTYGHAVNPPENVGPIQNFDHSVPTQHAVQYPPPYPSFVAVPSQSPSPLVGFQPLTPMTPVFFNSPSTTPGTPMSDPMGTPGNLNSPHAQQGHFNYGQPEMLPTQFVSPPVFNFQAYWATTNQVNPTSALYSIEEQKEKSLKKDDDKEDQCPSLSKNDDVFARKVIAQIVNLVKRTERTSETPLSDDDLVEQLFTISTRVPLLGETASPGITENAESDQDGDRYDHGSNESENDNVKDKEHPRESPDCG